MVVFPVLSAVLALVATVLAFVFIVPEKNRAKLNKFGKLLHDTVNFKFLIVEKILQALYIFSTATVVLYGFFMLFMFDRYAWYGGYGLLLMLFGPIGIRLVYEFTIMVVLLVKNVIQINNKLKADGQEKMDDVFNAPEFKNSAIPETHFCPNCGEKVDSGAFCTKCGTKL